MAKKRKSFAAFLGFQLPQHIDDFEKIDPIGCDDFNDGGIIVAIENRDLFQLSIWRRLFPPPSRVCWTSAIAPM